jgi:hypothetical protein
MKNKRIFSLFIAVLSLAAVILVLNIKVTTRQGIDYKIYTIRMPLYLKILDFYDRHFNYRWLARRITEGKTAEEEKVMAIFDWTVENIRHQPPELRVVDDHVWHIIVRGYGAHDQFSDAFSTLCNYAGFDAFFMKLSNKARTSKIPFAVVKINRKWYLFDPYNSIYFIKKDGHLASVEDIARGEWMVKITKDDRNTSKVEYSDYFSGILAVDFERAHKWSRANIQSPVNRFFYGIFKQLN